MVGETDKSVAPEAYHLKRIVRKDVNASRLLAFIDIQSHFGRKNAFLEGPYFSKNELNHFRSKFFALFMSKHSSLFKFKVRGGYAKIIVIEIKLFDIQSCRFTNK